MLEDDSDDRYLTREIVDQLNLDLDISFFSGSSQLYNALHKEMPALILVDYNSSPEDGLQVLEKLKTDSSTKELPVIILTENNYPSLKANCYRAGASTVISKPKDMEGTREKIQGFFRYWLEVAEL